MTNDLTTLNGALMELGETLALNILKKGVEAQANEGLTTLANKILTIPSIYNLLLHDNGITGDITNNAFSYNNIISVTTDETGTLVNNNNTGGGRVYSAILPNFTYTDWEAPFRMEVDIVSGSDGVRVQILQDNSNYITRTLGELDNPTHITLEYDGKTANYYVNGNKYATYSANTVLTNPLQIRFYLPDNTSFKYKNFRVYSKYIEEDVPNYTIDLRTDKQILSKVNSDIATLTATVTDEEENGVEGVTLEFFKNSVSIGTATTNAQGEATKTYSSDSNGNINFVATLDSIVSNSVSIEDCIYYDDTEYIETRGTYTNPLTIASNVATGNDDWELTFQAKGIAKGGCLNIGASTGYNVNSNTANYRLGIGFDYVSNKLTYYANVRSTSSNGTSTGSPSANTYYSFKMIKSGTTITFYVDDSLYATKTASWVSNYNQYDLYPCLWSGTTTKFGWKNVKLKKINN